MDYYLGIHAYNSSLLKHLFNFLLNCDFIIIKDYHGDIGLLLFSFIFYIPGFIMVKKVIETIKEGRTL